MSTRDVQRKKVYDSEKAVFGDVQFKEHYNWEETKIVVNAVLEQSETCKVFTPFKRFKIRDGRGSRSAWWSPDDKTLNFPKTTRNDVFICHEIAHMLTDRVDKELMPHGSTFCSIYLNLIAELISLDKAIELMQEFEQRGVMYKYDLLQFVGSDVVNG